MLLIDEFNVVKSKFRSGLLTYEQAKEEGMPIINRINEKAKEIAKKYNQRPRTISFAKLMR